MITQPGYSSTFDTLVGLAGSPQARQMGDYFSRARTALQASPASSIDRYQQTQSTAATETSAPHWSKKKILMIAIGAYLAYKFFFKGLLQKLFHANPETEALYA